MLATNGVPCSCCGSTDLTNVHVCRLDDNNPCSPVIMTHRRILPNDGFESLCLECACSNPHLTAKDSCRICRGIVAALIANTGRP